LRKDKKISKLNQNCAKNNARLNSVSNLFAELQIIFIIFCSYILTAQVKHAQNNFCAALSENNLTQGKICKKIWCPLSSFVYNAECNPAEVAECPSHLAKYTAKPASLQETKPKQIAHPSKTHDAQL